MYILIDNDNICRFNGEIIEYGIFDEPLNKWKVTKNESIYDVLGDYYKKVEVDSLPDEYKDVKYCYTEEDGFYLNPNYSEPINVESEVIKLTQENIKRTIRQTTRSGS